MYKSLAEYLKGKYGMKIKKICIDGGFGCPNRDGTVGIGGCIYCGERGAGEHIDPTRSIRDQVIFGIQNTHADGFIAYFQNFTNTYADVSTLKERYDAALIDERIKVLAIGTRPDCIDREIASLLASYKETLDVWVELGLQTANDRVAEVMNRGYKTERYIEAARILTEYGIPFVTHMIIGLPDSTPEDDMTTVGLINSVGSFGIKIHSIYVMEGTRLAEMYREGIYTPPTREEYISRAVNVLQTLSPEIIVHRITGDCPKEMLVAPLWNTDKNEIISEIRARLT